MCQLFQRRPIIRCFWSFEASITKRETRNETKSYDSIHGFCELSAEHIPVACIFESLASRISRCNIKFNFLQSMWTNDVKLSSSEVPVLKQASKILSEETSLSVSSLANVWEINIYAPKMIFMRTLGKRWRFRVGCCIWRLTIFYEN